MEAMKKLLLVILGAVLLGGGGLVALRAINPGGGRGHADSSLPSHQAVVARVHALMDCIHAHGAPDVPYPTYDSEGYVTWPAGADQQLLPDSVIQACSSLYNQLPQRPQDHGLTQVDLDQDRLFARCMREQAGFTDWPDPQPDGSFPLPQDILREGKSPRFLQAINQTCNRYFPARGIVTG